MGTKKEVKKEKKVVKKEKKVVRKEQPFKEGKGNPTIAGINFIELTRIRDSKVRDFVEKGLLMAKPEFFEQPASSSGKYHPEYALGYGGLLRHTKAALILADELFPIYNFTEKQQDYIRAALILHDIEKPSKTHPIEVKLRLEGLRDRYPKQFDMIIPLIESHMGQWNLDGSLPVPKSDCERFVHLCDYLASRKCLEVTL